MDVRLEMELLPERLAICRLPPEAPLPSWFAECTGSFCSMTRTNDELSIIADDALVPADVRAERGWRAFMVRGPLDFALTGVMAAISSALAGAGVSLFAVSTYDTDYVLVREGDLTAAHDALAAVAEVVAGKPSLQ